MRATTLPLLYHNYHFPDRLLVAQARFEPMRLITHDEGVAMYGDSVLFV
jgi:PIN domain nuclease of toxin-antitoxin system